MRVLCKSMKKRKTYVTREEKDYRSFLKSLQKKISRDKPNYIEEMCVLVNQLEEEKRSFEQTLKKEKHALQQKCEQEKQVLQKELNNFKNVVETMKGKVECPVCMEIPKRGPVPMCCNGHFICSPCLDKRKRDSKYECVTCKVGMGGSMGDIKSLLATVVLENVEHQCDLSGCSQMVHYREYKKHQEQCEHRMVICPGYRCSKLVPFKDIPYHILACPGKCDLWKENGKSGYTMRLPIEKLGKEALQVWNTNYTYFNSSSSKQGS